MEEEDAALGGGAQTREVTAACSRELMTPEGKHSSPQITKLQDILVEAIDTALQGGLLSTFSIRATAVAILAELNLISNPASGHSIAATRVLTDSEQARLKALVLHELAKFEDYLDIDLVGQDASSIFIDHYHKDLVSAVAPTAKAVVSPVEDDESARIYTASCEATANKRPEKAANVGGHGKATGTVDVNEVSDSDRDSLFVAHDEHPSSAAPISEPNERGTDQVNGASVIKGQTGGCEEDPTARISKRRKLTTMTKSPDDAEERALSDNRWAAASKKVIFETVKRASPPKRVIEVKKETSSRVPALKVDHSAEPKWWNGTTNPQLKRANRTQVIALISYQKQFKACIQKLTADGVSAEQVKHAIDEIRRLLHELAFQDGAAPEILKARIMHPGYGLSLIIDDGGSKLPRDIVSYAQEIRIRWVNEVFGNDLLRGLQWKRSATGKLTASLRTDIPHISADCFGHNGLIVGQVFFNLLCALRNGAHGCTQGGIYGSVEHGAYSIVLGKKSGDDFYADDDQEYVIFFSGTLTENQEPTRATQILLKSAETGNPLRLIRTSKHNSEFSPEEGSRYEGLHKVVKTQEVNPALRGWKVEIRRLRGQDPIRCKGPGKRPTALEVETMRRLKR